MSDLIKKIKPERNAVIYELVEIIEDDGSTAYKPIIHIECKDERLLDVLHKAAHKLFVRSLL